METYHDNTFDESQSIVQSNEKSRELPQIAILGASYVGKTQIFSQLMNRGFQEQAEQGNYEQQFIELTVNNSIFEFLIADVPDTESFYKSFLNNCKGYILVFSLNDPHSFNKMKDIYEEIIKNNGKLGNKKDLPKEEIKVRGKEIKNFYKDYKVEYQKLSAKEDKNIIDQMFSKLAGNIYADESMISKQRILTSSLGLNNQYMSQTITQVRGSYQREKYSFGSTKKDDYFCDNGCKKCSIF